MHRALGNLDDRREHIFKNAAPSRFDLGRDSHARRQIERLSVGDNGVVFQLDGDWEDKVLGSVCLFGDADAGVGGACGVRLDLLRIGFRNCIPCDVGDDSRNSAVATYTTFSNWRAAFPTQETVAGGATFKATNPSLVGTVPVGNINGFNPALLGAYKTQGASVCRNGGQNIASLFGISVGSQDLFANAIPQGVFDIGCFESA